MYLGYTNSMNKKTIVYIFSGVGLTLGSMIPMLWGDDPLGGWSMLLAFVGGIAGIWLGVKVGNSLG